MRTIAVIFGGRSTEHDVSIVTALASVIKPLELAGEFRVVPIYIAKDGAWYSDDKLKDISTYSSGRIEPLLEKIDPVVMSIDQSGLTLSKKSRFGASSQTHIDVVFPSMHGTYGEDGSLMGMLRMAGVPFVGCDLEASAIAMNKLLSHEVVAAAGVQSHPYVGLTRTDFENNSSEALDRFKGLAYPLFVKPVHLGSSIGITKVTQVSDLREALEVAFSYDTVAIVEEAVPNLIEVTVPVMGTTDDPKVALVERPLFAEDQVFDFDTKYMNGGKKGGSKVGGKGGSQGYSELPAKLPGDLYEQSELLAKKVFSAVGCFGIARIDLLIDSEKQRVYFNEINPLPGGLYDHNWRAAGVSSVELVQKLVNLADERANEQRSVNTTFSTNFLKQF